MALTTQKSITLTGTSKIGDVAVVSMTANITKNGAPNSFNTVLEPEIYDANKADCRADMDAFTAQMRQIEDEEN